MKTDFQEINQIFNGKDIHLYLNQEENSYWLNRKEISKLFNKSRPTIAKLIDQTNEVLTKECKKECKKFEFSPQKLTKECI